MGKHKNKKGKKIRIDELNSEDDILNFLSKEFGGDISKKVNIDDESHLIDEDDLSDEDTSFADDDIEYDENDLCDLDECVVKTYWTNETEDAIVEFLYLNEFFYDARINEEVEKAEKQNRPVNRSFCSEMERRKLDVLGIENREILREKIFKEKIEQPVKKLIENILFRYKLILPDTDVKTQQRDCITSLYLKFPNFNPWLQTKSFSYFGTITKHYFLGNKKDYAKNTKTVQGYDLFCGDGDDLSIENPKQEEDVSNDLFNFVTDYIEGEISKNNLSKNDQRVGNAIVQIFKSHEIIGVYSKSQIYQLIRENTMMDPKDITYSLQRFKSLYKTMKKNFIEKKKS